MDGRPVKVSTTELGAVWSDGRTKRLFSVDFSDQQGHVIVTQRAPGMSSNGGQDTLFDLEHSFVSGLRQNGSKSILAELLPIGAQRFRQAIGM